ncbi:hypothetical protein AB0F72_08665 [Actinoplanes sp. NPDC023936]|uniref:hypothetical protein n=1 Tax=Actinoplanes sp. NPDC023936 TaxID=3154910 RepID=UPI0033E07A46
MPSNDDRASLGESVLRQDASGHMPLAVCLDGRVIDLVPDGADTYSAEGRAALYAAAAAEIGVASGRFEILAVCHRHPTSSAVDCLDCEPA